MFDSFDKTEVNVDLNYEKSLKTGLSKVIEHLSVFLTMPLAFFMSVYFCMQHCQS